MDARRRRQIHQEIARNSISFFFLMPQIYQNDVNIGAKYNQEPVQQTAAKHVSEITKKHVFAKG